MMVVRKVLAVVVWAACAGYAIDWVIEIISAIGGQSEGFFSYLVAIKGSLMIATFMLGAWLWGALDSSR